LTLMNKAGVMFRSASTTPDVIQLPTTYVGEFSGSGYLRTLNKFVSGSAAPAFWTGMPQGVQAMSTIGGNVYAVNAGQQRLGPFFTTRPSWQGRDQAAVAAKDLAGHPDRRGGDQEA